MNNNIQLNVRNNAGPANVAAQNNANGQQAIAQGAGAPQPGCLDASALLAIDVYNAVVNRLDDAGITEVVAAARAAMRGPIPAAAAFLLQKVGTPEPGESIVAFLHKPHVMSALGGAGAMLALPSLEKILSAGHDVRWDSKYTDENRTETKHRAQRNNAKTKLLETGTSTIISAAALGTSLKASTFGQGPQVAISIGVGVGFIFGFSTLTACQHFFKALPNNWDKLINAASDNDPHDTYQQAVRELESVVRSPTVRIFAGLTGASGGAGVLAGVILAATRAGAAEAAGHSVSLTADVVPAITSAYLLLTSFVDLAVAFQEVSKPTRLAKADKARRLG